MRGRTMRSRAALVAAAVLVAASAAATPVSAATTWRVAVTNLTPPGSQPFSGPMLAVHSRRVDVWSPGERARRGVALIAEDGDTSVLAEQLAGRRGVRSVRGVFAGVAPQRTRTYTVRSRGRRNRLTLLTMLVNTNDGFTGLDALRLRRRTVTAYAYDAGSERNSESASTVPGPCCGAHGARDRESRPIRRHPGIAGIGDIDPARYGWQGPVARISVRRVR